MEDLEENQTKKRKNPRKILSFYLIFFIIYFVVLLIASSDILQAPDLSGSASQTNEKNRAPAQAFSPPQPGTPLLFLYRIILICSLLTHEKL